LARRAGSCFANAIVSVYIICCGRHPDVAVAASISLVATGCSRPETKPESPRLQDALPDQCALPAIRLST